MNRFFYILILVSCAVVVQAQTNYVDLVWSDEFGVNGAPNSANWGYDLGQSGFGNNEVQNYTTNTQNVRVENGLLIIDAVKSGSNWSSARLKSQGKKSFTYGRVVFRARLPQGSGTWPALWMLGESVSSAGWPACGEIDIMEHVGRNPGVVQAAMHTPSSNGNTVNKGSTTVGTFDSEFHLYEALWTPEKIQFSVDGVPYYTYNPSVKNASTWPFTAPQFIIMNIAMGGNLGSDPQYETGGQKNGIDPALTLARMEVDYVRVYQPFTNIRLQGNNIIPKNQTGVSFATNDLEGASYEWTVPNDVQITGGNGTSQVTLNWGVTEGDVKVKVTLNSQVYEKSISVVHPVKPQGSVYSLTAPEFGIAWSDQDPVNQYNLSEDDGTRVDYNVTAPASSLGLRGEFFRPLDMSDHPILKVKVKSFNQSNSLNMRIDLLDENGNATNKPPVFNMTPVIDDGEYYTYTFNYETQNLWKSNSADITSSRILGANFYIDFGVFGVVDQDSLWIDNVWVEDGTTPPPPNRPSHLSGNLIDGFAMLEWQDNASNETGFKIYKSAVPEGPFEEIETLPQNTTSKNVALDINQTRYYYRVQSFNADGQSDRSNTHQPDIITRTEDELSELITVYPNPSSGKFLIQSDYSSRVKIKVRNMLGSSVLTEVLLDPNQTTEVDLTGHTCGAYLLEIFSNARLVRKKIILF